jgi:hypothetical protein
VRIPTAATVLDRGGALLRPARLSLVVIVVAYVVLRVWSFWHEFEVTPAATPDGVVYEHISTLSLFSLSFWTGWEPWGLPLFYKLLPGPTEGSAPVVQWVISVASWLVLASVVATFVRDRLLKAAGFALVLALSLTPSVGLWDGALLSESLTLSESALLVAALLVLCRTPNRRNAAFVAVVALLFAGMHDVNGYLALMLLVPVAVAVWLAGSKRVAVAVAAVAIAAGAMAYVTSGVERWQIWLRNTVALRVLASPNMTRYFVVRGMPIEPGLQELLYSMPDPPSPFADQPALDEMHTWFLQHGRSTFVSYLITHPSFSLIDPLEELGRMEGPTSAPSGYVVAPDDSFTSSLAGYEQPGYRPALSGLLGRLAYPGKGWTSFWAVMAGAVLLIALGLAKLGRRFWVVPAACMLATVPYAIIVWDGDPEEIARHSLLVGVLGRLGLWLALVFVADAALERIRLGRGRSSAGPLVGGGIAAASAIRNRSPE